jgi:hypothetical protein
MQLPFSRSEFFQILVDYNTALWPVVIGLWIVTAVGALLLRFPPGRDRLIAILLAFHWAWSAIAYHALFFTRINPAAWLFAALFLAQATLFLWFGVVRVRLAFGVRHDAWGRAGWILVAYSLAYPAINVLHHGSFVAVPTFGLPCPTTIFTAGVLLLTTRPARILAIVPVIWSVIGGSAAFLMGVTADYALPISGALVTAFELQKRNVNPGPARNYALPRATGMR